MNNFKKFIIPGTIALTIIGSSTAFAVGSPTSANRANEIGTKVTMDHRGEAKGNFGERIGKGGFENREDSEAVRLERQKSEAAILEGAEILIPGATAKLESVQTELNTAREAFQVEMNVLRAKVENGEITREEMRESLGDKMRKRGHGINSERPTNPWSELESAIEAEDADAAQTAFDSILAHITERLTDMNERLSTLQ